MIELCPKCNGEGVTSKPIDGDVNDWADTQNGHYTCKLCRGKGYVIREAL